MIYFIAITKKLLPFENLLLWHEFVLGAAGDEWVRATWKKKYRRKTDRHHCDTANTPTRPAEWVLYETLEVWSATQWYGKQLDRIRRGDALWHHQNGKRNEYTSSCTHHRLAKSIDGSNFVFIISSTTSSSLVRIMFPFFFFYIRFLHIIQSLPIFFPRPSSHCKEHHRLAPGAASIRLLRCQIYSVLALTVAPPENSENTTRMTNVDVRRATKCFRNQITFIYYYLLGWWQR